MPSNYETFWDKQRYAVVGHVKKKNFPVLTFRGLRQLGKRVFPVDPSSSEIEGERVYRNLAELPEPVDAVVLEVPREETRDWVADAADAGIHDVWIHLQRETPEALALAKQRGLNVRSGACAVMYLTPGLTYHRLHRWIVKLAGKY